MNIPNLDNIYQKVLDFREKHIKDKQFILILAFVTGLGCALAAFLLKSSIHFVQNIVKSLMANDSLNYWYLAFPAVGIIIASLFVKYIVKDDISHGVLKFSTLFLNIRL